MATEFNLQPVLQGERITIRPIAEADWDEMFAVAADPAIWEQHPADRHLETEFRAYFDDALASGSALTFVERATGRIIGSSRYHALDPDRREIEIGWTFLGRDYWGGNVNREIKQLMLDHALQFVDTVVFWVGETNMRSRRAMEKIGGVLRDGTHTKDFSGDDPYVVYEIGREQCEYLRQL